MQIMSSIISKVNGKSNDTSILILFVIYPNRLLIGSRYGTHICQWARTQYFVSFQIVFVKYSDSCRLHAHWYLNFWINSSWKFPFLSSGRQEADWLQFGERKPILSLFNNHRLNRVYFLHSTFFKVLLYALSVLGTLDAIKGDMVFQKCENDKRIFVSELLSFWNVLNIFYFSIVFQPSSLPLFLAKACFSLFYSLSCPFIGYSSHLLHKESSKCSLPQHMLYAMWPYVFRKRV